MEYVQKAFSKIDDINAKRIVLHLFKHKGRELIRTEIKKQLNLEITNGEPKYLYATGVYCIGFA